MSTDTLASKILTALCEAGNEMRYDVAQIVVFALGVATEEASDTGEPTALQIVADIYAHLHALQHQHETRRYHTLALAA